MTKLELRCILMGGEKLEDIFNFTNGQECLIYKGKFLPGIMGDDICYIPDVFLNEIPINRPVSEDEIDDIVESCYTTNDFLNACDGHEKLARNLFNYVDWQHPNIDDFLEGYSRCQFFKDYGFSISEVSDLWDAEEIVTEDMKSLLSQISDLTAQASKEIYDDDDWCGTSEIISLCDELHKKISSYLIKGYIE